MWEGGGGGNPSPSVNVFVDRDDISEIGNFQDVVKIDGENVVSGYKYLKKNVTYVNKSSEYNTMDNVLFMIRRLEGYAKSYLENDEDYLDENGEYTFTNANINNLVLGYIRGINANYNPSAANNIYEDYEEYTDKWNIVCGSIDEDFYGYVEDQDISNGCSFKTLDFFASFLQSRSDFWEPEGTDIDESVLDKHYYIDDPMYSGQDIDLIHMIAAIDGIYASTGQNVLAISLILFDNHQRDLVSWLGDLQQLTNSIRKYQNWNNVLDYNLDNGHIDFNSYINEALSINYATGFSAEDLLADIDAMNISKLFLDADNLLSDSISVYYTTISYDSSTSVGNRYDEFVYSVTRDLEVARSGNLLTDFRNEIFNSMNIDYENGEYVDSPIYSETSYDLSIMKDSNGIPDFEVRFCTTNLFYTYILEMCNRF